MNLRTYLRMQRVTVADFAARIGASEAAVGKWSRGERIPRRAMMARIQVATDGQVTPADFYAWQDAPAKPEQVAA
jgi:transcriptional regulator with XRE-family HTH domain